MTTNTNNQMDSQVERSIKKVQIQSGSTCPTLEAYASTRSACDSCMHSEQIAYYSPRMESKMRDTSNQKYLVGVNQSIETLCSRQMMRPMEVKVSGCTLYEPQPGLKEAAAILAQQS